MWTRVFARASEYANTKRAKGATKKGKLILSKASSSRGATGEGIYTATNSQAFQGPGRKESMSKGKARDAPKEGDQYSSSNKEAKCPTKV